MQANTTNMGFHPEVTNSTKQMIAKTIMSEIMAALFKGVRRGFHPWASRA